MIIGLSGTPLCDAPAEASALMGLVKGRSAKDTTDEAANPNPPPPQTYMIAHNHITWHTIIHHTTPRRTTPRPTTPFHTPPHRATARHTTPHAILQGFISYYMDTPPSVFPRLMPVGLPYGIPTAAVRSVPLRNIPLPRAERRRRGPEGNRKQYESKVADELSR